MGHKIGVSIWTIARYEGFGEDFYTYTTFDVEDISYVALVKWVRDFNSRQRTGFVGGHFDEYGDVMIHAIDGREIWPMINEYSLDEDDELFDPDGHGIHYKPGED